jgi:hypothetical protein
LLATVTLTSPGPITSITIADDTSFQVRHAEFSHGQIYPADLGPADAGFFVRLDSGQVIGLDIPGRDAVYHNTGARSSSSVGWSPVSLTLSADELSATLVARNPTLDRLAGQSLLLTQVISYEPEFSAFRIESTLQNQGDASITFDAFAAADIYLADSDWGVGTFDSTTGAVGGVSYDGLYAILLTPNSARGLTPTSYQEGRYRDLWTIVGGGDPSLGLAPHFDNSVLFPTQSAPYHTDPAFRDNGIGLEWQSITLLAGQSARFAYSFSFGDAPPAQPPPNNPPPNNPPPNNPIPEPLPPLSITGTLDPASDHGPSNSDGITNVNRPVFRGQATAGATLTLTATPDGPGAPLTSAPVTISPDGSWSAVFPDALPDGQFTITATITRGTEPASTVTLLGGPHHPLVIDTVGPRVTGLKAALRARRIVASLQDDRAGLDLSGVADSSSYNLSFGTARRPHALALTPSLTQPASPGSPVSVTLTPARRILAGRRYVLTISDTIRDLAGNALDGEYRRALPSGDSQPGAVFQASLLRRGLSLMAVEPVGTLKLAALVRARKKA